MENFFQNYIHYAKAILKEYPNHHVLIFGRPGSGKGTLAAAFAELGFEHIGIGKLIRKHLRESSTIASRFESELTNKLSVPDNLATDMTLPELRQVLESRDKYFVLEGYPSSNKQYLDFKSFIQQKKAKVIIIYLKVPRELAIKRSLIRRTCPHCHHSYTPTEEECLFCSRKLHMRADDTFEIIQERQQIFDDEAVALADKFKLDFPFITKLN